VTPLERFDDERLHAVVHGMQQAALGNHVPPEPERPELSVIHAWGSAGAGGAGT
jgi:hypothetical protein